MWRWSGGLGTRAALVRTSLTVVLPGLGWVLLLAAPSTGKVLLVLPGVALVLISVVESRHALVGRSCGHDRWSGSVVVPASWHRRVERIGAGRRWPHAR